jgi:hypothetical protein
VTGDEAPPLDRAAILGVFARHGAQFVVVGGIAGQAHGATRLTKDLDLCPAWTMENLGRVAAALKDLDARLKVGEGSIELLDVALDAKTLANMEIVPWRTRAGDVDILLGIPTTSRSALARYDQLVANATLIEVDDQRIMVASLQDVIRSKEVTDRPKDRAALAELRQLLEREREREVAREPEPGGFGFER